MSFAKRMANSRRSGYQPDISERISVDGVQDVIKRLQDAKLKGNRNTKIIRSSLKFAARPMKRTAKQRVPEDEGRLKKSIGYITPRRPDVLAIDLGPRVKGKWEGYHGHLVEKGTAPRKLKKPRYVKLNGQWVRITHTGSMPATPYMEPAYQANKHKTETRFETKIRRLVKKEFST